MTLLRSIALTKSIKCVLSEEGSVQTVGICLELYFDPANSQNNSHLSFVLVKTPAELLYTKGSTKASQLCDKYCKWNKILENISRYFYMFLVCFCSYWFTFIKSLNFYICYSCFISRAYWKWNVYPSNC